MRPGNKGKNPTLTRRHQFNFDGTMSESSENHPKSEGHALESIAQKFEPLMASTALLGLSPCCRQTVRSHVAHNPMMVCPDCKMMIKCFADDKSFNNYVTFCRSRGRRIKTAQDSGFYFVMYNNYPTKWGHPTD